MAYSAASPLATLGPWHPRPDPSLASIMLFADRADAGGRLAVALNHHGGTDAVVLGLPRGGVPVAARVAEYLGLSLDAVMVRKLGSPRRPEYAIGAIGEGGVRIIDDAAVARTGVTAAELAVVEVRESSELSRRGSVYRAGRAAVDLVGRVAIVVDDGVATGATARVACTIVRAMGAATVVLATPVAPVDWIDAIGPVADEFVAVSTPTHFVAVGQWYRRFDQTNDEEVIRLLRNGVAEPHVGPAG